MWPVTGCLDPAADNYASYAVQGVSTMCEYGGCNDTEASNFNPTATYNSGVCIYPKIGCTVRMRFAAFIFYCLHACMRPTFVWGGLHGPCMHRANAESGRELKAQV